MKDLVVSELANQVGKRHIATILKKAGVRLSHPEVDFDLICAELEVSDEDARSLVRDSLIESITDWLAGVCEPIRQIDDNILSKPLSEFGLGRRTFLTIVKNANVQSIGELTKKTERELLICRRIGRNSVREIKRKLADIGLSLAEEPKPAS